MTVEGHQDNQKQSSSFHGAGEVKGELYSQWRRSVLCRVLGTGATFTMMSQRRRALYGKRSLIKLTVS